MKLLESITKMLRPETFNGRVVNVQQIFSEGRNNLHKQMVRLHHGYDKYGMPIKEDVMQGVFYVVLENSEGLRRTFRTGVCLEPKIGSYQKYQI